MFLEYSHDVSLVNNKRLFPQNKYQQSGKQSMSTSLFSQLPQTSETQLAAKMSELQSEVNAHLR